MNTEATPIKLGDRFLTQEEFNRMYTHYSELCDKEDTNGWWENQFHMANAQLQDLERWKKEAIAVMPDYQAIGKAIGVPLGQSIPDKILPAIQEMKQREELMNEIADYAIDMFVFARAYYKDVYAKRIAAALDKYNNLHK